jgi:adenosylcobyric acid synthase
VSGALLVAGTTSDAGKSVVVAGLCRWLSRRGVKVAPFKAQNMALHSGVTAEGLEIGRAQMVQAAAAGVPPEVAMNPILLKPTSERGSQVVVMGLPAGVEDARSYQRRKASLQRVVLDALSDLRARFDVVVCEGAGSPAEINLRHGDLANMGLARAAELPTLVVGDIDRGGVLAALYGTLALLEPADQALIAGFVVNKFRGDPAVLAPGLEQLQCLTGRPTLGVLPWTHGLELDAEDSLSQEGAAVTGGPPLGRDGLVVAVVRLRAMSNATDVDALAAEPGVVVRVTDSPVEVDRADLAVIPGSKATVADLERLHDTGVASALVARARRGAPVLGICGGYQVLGETIVDEHESRRGEVAGLGLLPVITRFEADKVLATPSGISLAPVAGHLVQGYQIHHGRVRRRGGEPLIASGEREDGCVLGAVLGTSWHGLLESDGYRRALLRWVADRCDRDFEPGTVDFAGHREARLDRLGDLIAAGLDTGAVLELLEAGAPAGLPVVAPAGGGR